VQSINPVRLLADSVCFRQLGLHLSGIIGEPAQLTPGFAWYLPGVGSGTGIGLREELTTSAFSGPNRINRAVHMAGGELQGSFAPKAGDYSIVFWFWLGERSGASERSGTLCVSPFGDTLSAKQSIDHQVRLELNGVATDMEWSADDWHQVSIVHEKGNVAVYVDESSMPVAETNANSLVGTQQSACLSGKSSGKAVS